ncbi:MAG: hypothetical protein ACYTGX_09630 [Planctomycetota bacterium]|jgi:hypothetical protein
MSLWIESEDDNEPVDGKWIVQRLRKLIARLRRRDARFAELEPWRFLDPEAVYRPAAQRDHRSAVAVICGKYGLDPDRVSMTWTSETGGQNIAAHVRSEPWGAIDVTLRENYRSSPAGFGTVMAHELGHAYLTDMDIPNGGGWEGEATTDLVTFAKGLGKLTVNGVEHLGYGQQAGSKGYGYLNREAVVFAYARAVQRYRVSLGDARAGLSSAALGYFNVLHDDQPGCLGNWFKILFGSGATRGAPLDRDLAVDEHGNIVDRRSGETL